MTKTKFQKQIYINLPVANLEKATDFYTKLGFKKHKIFSDNKNANGMIWSDTIVVMLTTKSFYKNFIGNRQIADTKKTSAVLNCISVNSKKVVDKMAEIAKENKGKVWVNKINEELAGDFMYSKSIADQDGHIWEVSYMDMSKMNWK